MNSHSGAGLIAAARRAAKSTDTRLLDEAMRLMRSSEASARAAVGILETIKITTPTPQSGRDVGGETGVLGGCAEPLPSSRRARRRARHRANKKSMKVDGEAALSPGPNAVAPAAVPLVAAPVNRVLEKKSSRERSPRRPGDVGGTSAASTASPFAIMLFSTGDAVILQNLAQRTDLNERRGTVISYDSTSQRFCVRVDGVLGGPGVDDIKVRATNLRKSIFANAS